MERIKSFEIDHNLLTPGFYISREDGDVITYDLRTRKPNAGDYMTNLAMHSVEHMFATFVRNSRIASDVVYFGPMGCQTGFYLLVKNQKPADVFAITKEVLAQILAYEGPVFGASAVECGNYRNLDLAAAKEECRAYLDVLEKQDNPGFTYPTKEEESK
jgi:S-ribosylhomocysteine lyase